MLQNVYFLAKIGADTADNERKFAEILPKFWQKLATSLLARAPRVPDDRGRRRLLGALRDGPRLGARRRRDRSVREIGTLSKILQIFGGLVLGCIKTKFCKKICV